MAALAVIRPLGLIVAALAVEAARGRVGRDKAALAIGETYGHFGRDKAIEAARGRVGRDKAALAVIRPLRPLVAALTGIRP